MNEVSRRKFIGVALGAGSMAMLPGLAFGAAKAAKTTAKQTSLATGQAMASIKALIDELRAEGRAFAADTLASDNNAQWNRLLEHYFDRKGFASISVNAANLCPSLRPVNRMSALVRDMLEADISFPMRGELAQASLGYGLSAVKDWFGLGGSDAKADFLLALTANSTMGNNFVNNGLVTSGFMDPQKDNIVVWDVNHPTNYDAWMYRKATQGWGADSIRILKTKMFSSTVTDAERKAGTIPSDPQSEDEIIAALLALVDARTKLVTLSWQSNECGMVFTPHHVSAVQDVVGEAGALVLPGDFQAQGQAGLRVHGRLKQIAQAFGRIDQGPGSEGDGVTVEGQIHDVARLDGHGFAAGQGHLFGRVDGQGDVGRGGGLGDVGSQDIGLGVAGKENDIAFLESAGPGSGGGGADDTGQAGGLGRGSFGSHSGGDGAGSARGNLLIREDVKSETTAQNALDHDLIVAALVHILEGRQGKGVGFGVHVQDQAAVAIRGELLVQGLAHESRSRSVGGERRGAGGADEAVELPAQAKQIPVDVVGQGLDGFRGLHGDDAVHDLEEVVVGQIERGLEPLIHLDLGHGRADVSGGRRGRSRRNGLGLNRGGDRNVDGGAFLGGQGRIVGVHQTRHDAGPAQGKQALRKQAGNDNGKRVGHGSAP